MRHGWRVKIAGNGLKKGRLQLATRVTGDGRVPGVPIN
jgi:hypothetical protein